MDGRRKNRNRIENCAREEPGNDRIEKDASVCRALFCSYRKYWVIQRRFADA